MDALDAMAHGDHGPFRATACATYAGLPGRVRYSVKCTGCGSEPADARARRPVGLAHALAYMGQWRDDVPESCEEARRLNLVREVMGS